VAELISSSKDWNNEIELLFDTYIPSINESADIQTALKLFFFGNANSGSDTSPDSIYEHLKSIQQTASGEAAVATHNSNSTGVHGLGTGDGSVVGTTKSQELTNKTITAPSISNPRVNSLITLSARSQDLNILTNTTVTQTEFGYLSGASAAIQTQLNNKLGSTATAVNASRVGGRTIFVQSATPTANAIGDIWFQVTGL